MKDIVFPENVQKTFNAFSDIAKNIGEHPIIIGGFIRDHIARGYSDGDVDVVLRYGKNLSFVQGLKIMGSSDSEVFGNTGTIHIMYNNLDIEIQSSNNPLVHFNIDNELQSMGLELSWINRNVYERDFTINTIIYDIVSGSIIDATGNGVNDLINNKIIRCPINPSVALKNNPIIITRAIKFSLDFGLTIDSWFMQEAVAFKNEFIKRINDRNNRHYLKSYIRQTFDIDFDKSYEYYEKIGFLDAIPVGEDLEKQIQQRKMGIIYRKPIMKKKIISSFNKTKEDNQMNRKNEIQMRLDKDNNSLFVDFCLRDISARHKVAFLDLFNNKNIDNNTNIYFLDSPKSPKNVTAIFEDSDKLNKTALEIDQHLYDSIKGKREYKERKKKEHRRDTLKMYKVLDKVRKILENDGVVEKGKGNGKSKKE